MRIIDFKHTHTHTHKHNFTSTDVVRILVNCQNWSHGSLREWGDRIKRNMERLNMKQDNTFSVGLVFEIGLGVPSEADSDELATVVALSYKQQRHMIK